MKIAYIISAYKNPEQLVRLILRLNAGETNFLVHVDKKTDDRIFDQVVQAMAHLPHVTFLKRHACYWGGFGHVRATIKGLCEIFKRGIPFDYVILLTGQDYPIKTNDYIKSFLAQKSGQSFMEHFPLPSDAWEGGGLQRLERWHFRFRNHRFVFPGNGRFPNGRFPNGRFPIRRKLPGQLHPFGGSSYWCLSKECARYIHDFIHNNGRFVKYFHFVDVPDEIFFQTIVMNSPYAGTIVNDNLRYIEWNDPASGSPAVLCRRDFPKIARAPHLFARKFDMFVDNEVLDLIDQELGVI